MTARLRLYAAIIRGAWREFVRVIADAIDEDRGAHHGESIAEDEARRRDDSEKAWWM